MHYDSYPINKRSALLSRIALILFVLVVIPVLFISYRLIPAFLDYHFMVTTARHMVQGGVTERMSDSQIRNDFAATMRLNHIHTFQPGALSVERLPGMTLLVIAYTVDIEVLPGSEITLAFQKEVP